jgi:hypothetical protein
VEVEARSASGGSVRQLETGHAKIAELLIARASSRQNSDA